MSHIRGQAQRDAPRTGSDRFKDSARLPMTGMLVFAFVDTRGSDPLCQGHNKSGEER